MGRDIHESGRHKQPAVTPQKGPAATPQRGQASPGDYELKAARRRLDALKERRARLADEVRRTGHLALIKARLESAQRELAKFQAEEATAPQVVAAIDKTTANLLRFVSKAETGDRVAITALAIARERRWLAGGGEDWLEGIDQAKKPDAEATGVVDVPAAREAASA